MDHRLSEKAPEGTEFRLEPAKHPAVRPSRTAMVEDGVPSVSFADDDVEAEYARLVARGARFVQPPTDLGTVVTAAFDDIMRQLDSDRGDEGSIVTIATAPVGPTC